MLIYKVWDSFFIGYCFGYKYTSAIRILICLLLSIVALPFDIVLFPLEIISFIILKLLPKEINKE